MDNAEKAVCYSGEVMLLAWAESNTRGRTVTFQMNEDGEAHPFKDMTVRKGGRAGQRFMMVLVELGDDEKPVEKTPSQLCFLLCQDQQFQYFLNERALFGDIDCEEKARAFILEACKIDSRSKLDSNMTARATWEATIYQPWLQYKKAQLSL